jgi:GT2 family glycosyltransferase
MPIVTVIIVNWNTRDILRECLASLPDGLKGVTNEVFVVDNGSTDGSGDMVQEVFPYVHLVRNKENMGFSKANNQALQQATGNYYLLLNSDVLLKPGTVARLVAFLSDDHRKGMVGPRFTDIEGRLQPTTYPAISILLEILRLFRAYYWLPASWAERLFLGSFWKHDYTRPVGRLTGACILVRAECIRQIGLFDEAFYFYGEVHDWCWNLWKNGWQVFFYSDAEVIHIGGYSARKRWGILEKRRRVLEANHLLLKKHTSLLFRLTWYFINFLSNSLALIWRVFDKGADSSDEDLILRWEIVWFMDRIGIGRIKETVKNVILKFPLLHWVFIMPFRRSWNTSWRDLLRWWQEATVIERYIHEKWVCEQGAFIHTGMMDFSEGRFLYLMVRALRPERIVETGVANGASSTFLLSAMEANGKGELFSLDLPTTEEGVSFIPVGKTSGWLIPENLRNRWYLTLGDTHKELPSLLNCVGQTDIFIHDSDHTYETMSFEFRQAWPHIKNGGWLISDDVMFNAAFYEWALVHKLTQHVWSRRLGLMRKT